MQNSPIKTAMDIDYQELEKYIRFKLTQSPANIKY